MERYIQRNIEYVYIVEMTDSLNKYSEGQFSFIQL